MRIKIQEKLLTERMNQRRDNEMYYFIFKKTFIISLLFLFILSCTEKRDSLRRSMSSKSALSLPSPMGYNVGQAGESELKLASRVFVVSTLSAIFGPSIKTDLEETIEREVFRFGGACDANNPSSCPSQVNLLSGSDVSSVPKFSSGRAGIQIKACDRIVQKNSAIEYALREINAWPLVSNPRIDDIAQAYQLFYPGKQPALQVIYALLNISSEAQKNNFALIDSWRFIFLTLCMSPDWQLL